MLVRELLETRNTKLFAAAVAMLLFFTVALALDAKPAFADGTVTVSLAGQGRATGPGIDCNQSGGPDCSEFYADQLVCEYDPETGRPICVSEPPYVELTAGPDGNGYVYNGWTGCDTVTSRTCGLTVRSNTSLTARFRDAQTPTVALTSPTGVSYVRGAITLSANASDNSGAISRVEFRVRGALVATDTLAPYSASFNTAAVSDGLAVIRATAFDVAGNSSFNERSVTIDNTAPALTMTAGPSGTVNSSTATFEFSASDANMDTVECMLDGSPRQPCASPKTYTGLTDGGHALWIVARDKAGNTRVLVRNWTVDTTKPAISLTSPAEGSYVRGAVPLRATASDISGVSRVQFYVERGSWFDDTHQSWIENDSTAPYEASWDSTKFPDGPVAVEAGAFDTAGNEAYHSYEVIVDNTAPTGSLEINGGAAYTRSAAVKLSLPATDPSTGSGVASMRFMNDGGSWSDWTPYATTKSWTLRKANGTRTVYAQYRDTAGNLSTAARDTIKLDMTKPTISGMSPRHRSIIRDTTPTISATVKDNLTNLSKGNIRLYVNGKPISAAKYSYSRATDKLVYNSPRLSKGKKVVKIVARDAAGNVGARSWYFTIR